MQVSQEEADRVHKMLEEFRDEVNEEKVLRRLNMKRAASEGWVFCRSVSFLVSSLEAWQTIELLKMTLNVCEVREHFLCHRRSSLTPTLILTSVNALPIGASHVPGSWSCVSAATPRYS